MRRGYEPGHQPPDAFLCVEPDQVSLESGLHIPRKLLMTNVFDETSTELVVEEIEIDPPVRDKVFSKKELAVGRR